MDDAEKLQKVSEEIKKETLEEVQNEVELRNENEPEVEEESFNGLTGEAGERSEEPIEQQEEMQEVNAEEVAVEKVQNERVEKPEEETVSSEKAESAEVEEDASDDVEDEQEEHEEELDFDHASKKKVVARIREVKNEDNIRLINRVLKVLKPRFDELYELSKNAALQKFVSEGNEADAFEYHGDELDKEFFTLYGQLKSRRNKHYKDLENQKEDNLKKKEHLLEQLREFVDGEESANSINRVRDLQTEWKKTGLVPGTQNKTLWASYNALLDRYYDNRSIYFELKDLDRKKNMRLKEELSEKAEALNEMEDMKTAIIQLNELHDEYKHLGPVSKENQEPLWQRFKAASDAIYARRKEHFEELKVELKKNLIKKEELIRKVVEFTKFNSDRITEWNEKTKELLEVQKQWEATGGVPGEKTKETNRAFWNSFKTFFAGKNQFFKELESKREENLKKKKELIEKANALKDSEEWNSTADKFKHLQTLWKDIGSVPEKVRKQTYKKFKTACDHFFNRRRDQNQEQFKVYEDNLQLKLQICDRLEAVGTGENINLNDLYDLIDNFTSVGFVPKNTIKKIRNRFDEVKEKVLSNEVIHEDDRTDLKNHILISCLKNTQGGVQKLNHREHTIRRKISFFENDISTWNTNIEFFANSTSADKLKADMLEKINKAEDMLENLKSQLAAISAQN